MLASETNALLYITDSKSYKHFKPLDDGKPFFEEKTFVLDEEFYKVSGLSDSTYYGNKRDLRVCCRRVDGTLIDKDERAEDYYKAANEILDKLIKKQ